MAGSPTHSRRRHTTPPLRRRVGLAAAYLLPALIVGAIGFARPSLSQAAIIVPCTDEGGITTCEFDTSLPNPTTWEVPAGVTQITITAAGGQGGGANGGEGAKIVATMDVEAGDGFAIRVGTWGTSAATPVGGGGAGGERADYMQAHDPLPGHRGGGASSVLYQLEIPVVVAGGGGGASGSGLAGGDGGYPDGTSGAGTPSTIAGGGATGSGGAGTPGTAGVAYDYVGNPPFIDCGILDDGLSGSAGTSFAGGDGGDGWAGGGGGGGGWPAGGGGAGSGYCNEDGTDNWGGDGGGGGGASYVDLVRADLVSSESGVGGGEGYVEISYATPGAPTYDGYLDTTLATGDSAPTDQDQDLTAVGATDWAIWGYASAGTSTSLEPDVRKSGGSGISDLTPVTGPVAGIPLRGLGQFDLEGAVPWRFDWSNGDAVATADSAIGGLQWDGFTGHEPSGLDVTGYGFEFTVPADTAPQRLHVWTHAHGSQGRLVAELSDDSAPGLDNGYVNATDSYDTPGLFVIDFAAASAGQTLTVTYTMDVRLADANSVSANPAIYAVALAPQLVTNGGFEQEPLIPEQDFTRAAGDTTVTGWTIGGDSINHVPADYWSAVDGSQSVDLSGDADGSVSQSLSTVPGQQYLLSFAYTKNPQWTEASMNVLWGSDDPVPYEVTGPILPGTGNYTLPWESASTVVTATGSTTSLAFVSTSGHAFGMALDDVSVIPLGIAGEEPTEVEAPVLFRAAPIDGDTTFVVGMTPEPGTYELEFLTSDVCAGGIPGSEPSVIGGFSVTTTVGEPYFVGSFDHTGTVDDFVAAQVTGPAPATSAVSSCIAHQPGNDSWPAALPLNVGSGGATTSGYLDSEGNARWFKFSISPGARVTIDLSGLPKDYDLFLFKDIAQAYDDLTTVADLTRISAEFAPSAFAPSAFAPSAFAPSAFAPSAFAPSAFAPSAFAPSAFAPSAFAPSAFAPSAFAPSAFAPSAFAPSAFAPSAFAPSAFAPSAFAPSAFAPSAFASAQVRSLMGISALPGTGDEWIVADTWNNTGDFYVRVTGKNGEFDTSTPFTLGVSISGTECTGTIPALGTKPLATAGGYETIVLTALDRMPGAIPGNDAAAKSSMLTALGALPNAVLVDVHAYTAALHAFADTEYGCPYYKNLVAGAIKDVVDDYRALNPDLANVVVVGNDDVIPFFRYPDQSLLGPEQDYVPPVDRTTTSEASLRSNMVLGQDEYGASSTISVRGATFPVPGLAVGRLVETATEVTGMVQAYLGTTGGVVPAPTSSLVTGYDFIADAADAIDDELTAGIGNPSRRVVTPGDVAPQDPRSWTADDLRDAFLEQRNDIAFLGGHFSAGGALAADFTTEMRSTELAASPVDFTNAIIFSIGCHAGYNVVDDHGLTGVTQTLDWAQAFAREGATLIAGTGYQYGDTDFIEYSERLYLEFAKQLRTGSGPVSVGDALVAAKGAYLQTTPDIRGLHEKSLLEATLFGLPMLSVDMPGARLPGSGGSSVVGSLQSYTDGPGADDELDLDYFDLSSTSSLVGQTKALTNLDGGPDVVTTHFVGPDGVTTNPLEPALPLQVKDVTVPGKVLRGVGFLGGSYTEQTVIPLTGAPNTEIRGVHIPFSSQVFFPIRPWTANYFDALSTDGGKTNLLITPVQHRSVGLGALEATARTFGSLQLRLFYSDNIETFGSGVNASTPALAAPPTITGVTATVDGQTVTFRANVVGNPAAGIQEVWVTYTGHANAFQTLYLTQSGDSTTWEGSVTLPSSVEPTDLRFMVQAVNGVGLVSTADDFGALFAAIVPGTDVPEASSLSLAGSATSGAVNDTVQVTAALTSDGPVAGKSILFVLGNAARVAVTDSSGVATTAMDVTATGPLQLTATFAGDDATGPSSASQAFAAAKAASSLDVVGPGVLTLGSSGEVSATLRSGSTYLTGKSIVFKFVAPGGATSYVTRDTDIGGVATVAAIEVPVGTHTVTAYFGQVVSIGGAGAVGAVDPGYSASSATTTYQVIWPFGGFFAPVDNPEIRNKVKAGSTVPFKFTLGGDRGLAIVAAGFPKATKYACTSGTAEDTVEETSSANSGLTYDPVTQQYKYNWKTPKSYKGSCYRFELKLIDGTSHTALFKFE